MFKQKLQLLTIGDTTTDVFMELKDASVLKWPEKRGDKLCVRFGDKVAVESVQEIEGVGNATNVAVGSARLGLKTGIWTVLGNDDDGQRIIEDVFAREGINREYVEFDQKNRTNYSLVLTHNAERTILAYHAPRTYVFPSNLPEAEWVYFTSLGKGWEKIVPDFLKYVERTGCKVAFNPGTIQLRSDTKEMHAVLQKTNTLFVNREEAVKILGHNTESTKELLAGLQTLGPENIVITDGVNGAVAILENTIWTMPVLPTEVIERTGCGDSFAAGFITARIKGKTYEEALLWGAVNASSVIRYVGSRAGLLTERQLQETMRNVSIQPTKL